MDNPHKIDLNTLQTLFNIKWDTFLDNKMLIQNFCGPKIYEIFKEPCRTTGYLAILCTEGELYAEINLTPVTISAMSIMAMGPGTMFRLTGYNKEQRLSTHIIAITDSFDHSVHIDFMKLFDESLSIMENPVIKLGVSEFKILSLYYKEIKSLISLEPQPSSEVIQHLISSVLYFLGDLWARKLDKNEDKTVTKHTARSRSIFNSFIKLVRENYSSERNMAFYANKLCLTPKYLSKIIKEISGKSAPEWIDTYVVMEAKNILRYTTTPIKEIVFLLNFPNQSVFYKFFKVHTGMTPSQYRNL